MALSGPVFIRDPTNDEDDNDINEVKVGGSGAEVFGLPAPDPMDAHPKQLERRTGEEGGYLVDTTVTGQNLAGVFMLSKGSTCLSAEAVFVNESDPAAHFSDCTEVFVIFDTSGQPAGTGWELKIMYGTGQVKTLSGFELVDIEPEE